MKIEIECTGTTAAEKEITKIYTSNVATRTGQNKAIERRHNQFWNEHPEIVSSHTRIVGDKIL